MTAPPEDGTGDGREARSSQSGFSLIELLAVVNIIALLASIAIPGLLNFVYKAQLARCMAELRGIQTGLYTHSEAGELYPDAATFWGTVYPSAKPGPYFYLADAEDPNAGHGNDLDGYDEQNPGNSAPRTQKDIKFVLCCNHDHKHLCKYVYIEDEGPPTLAFEGDDPGYQKFIKWEDGKQPGGKGKGKDKNK